MIDTVEHWLVQSLENALNWPYNKPLQAANLMPRPTVPSVKISHVVYARNLFLWLVGFVVLCFLFLAIYWIHLMLDTLTLHQIQRHYRTILSGGFAATKYETINMCLVPFMGTFLYTLYSSPQFWAWNHRADRLNREVMASDALVVADALGVRPPPPTSGTMR